MNSLNHGAQNYQKKKIQNLPLKNNAEIPTLLGWIRGFRMHFKIHEKLMYGITCFLIFFNILIILNDSKKKKPGHIVTGNKNNDFFFH